MIINYTVTISFCIDLFLIFIQIGKNILSPMRGYLARLKRESNNVCQEINRKIRKTVYEITKSWKINITQNMFLFLSSNIHVFLFLVMFVPYINCWSFRYNLDIINHPPFNIFFTNNFGKYFNCFPRRLNGDVIVKSDSWFNMKTLWVFFPLCCP